MAEDEYVVRMKQSLQAAVRTGNATDFANASDCLREVGFTYRQQMEVAREALPEITVAEWESMMAEAEEAGAP